jgi:two-component system NarL family sensor kinase
LGDAAVTGKVGRPQFPWERGQAPSPVEARAAELSALLLQLEQQFVERMKRLEAVEQRLRTLALRREESGRRSIRLIELERQRIGRELHTGVGQMLAAIHIQLETIEAEMPSTPAPVREALRKVATLAHDALEQVRDISRRVHPPEWQRLRLEDGLRQLWDLSGMDRRFETRVSIQDLENDPAIEIKSLVFRAAQEGIINVLRHAHARRVDLMLYSRNDTLTICVRDDGVGFDTTPVFAGPASVGSGIGLRSIREQAAELKGKLLVTSGPLGTTLEISIPWKPEPR